LFFTIRLKDVDIGDFHDLIVRLVQQAFNLQLIEKQEKNGVIL
jgi:hypothetical protein